MNRFARFAWGALAYEVAVVAWGAYVRATGSGAGCGNHWPLCDGVMVPRAPKVATLIELSHRLSSGGALILSVVLFAWALRSHPKGHPVRSGAAAAMGFMFAEALIGAALVLFKLVEHDASVLRALSVSLHLVNTFLLLASTALTAWWASGGARVRLSRQGILAWAMVLPLAALLLVGASGAVTALGDTLFPASSLAAGFRQDFSAGLPAADTHQAFAPLFVRLRVLHPLLAVTTAAIVLGALGLARGLRPSRAVRWLAHSAAALVAAQVGLGIVNVLALAPIWMQLAHLVLADAVWIALVLTAAAALADAPAAVAATSVPGARAAIVRP
jgi:heme A synthase